MSRWNITAIGFGTDTGPIDANNVLPVRDNNVDYGERDMIDISLKIDWETDLRHTDGDVWLHGHGRCIDPINSRTPRREVRRHSLASMAHKLACSILPAFSQEDRFSSPADQRVRWEIGAYYLDWERFVSLSQPVSIPATGIIRLEREPTTDPSNPTTSFLAMITTTTAKAVLRPVEYSTVTRQFELSLAMRYDKEERIQDVSPLQFPAGQPGARNTATFDKFQPKVTLRYQPTDSHKLLSSPGAKDSVAGNSIRMALPRLPQPSASTAFRILPTRKNSESIEIGFKGQYCG